MRNDLELQLHFLMEIDQMKQICRQNLIADGSRRENDAEHSWHMAMTALVLSEYAAWPINLSRVLQMCLVHDLIEVYAGDTFCYDKAANEEKEQRERAAADRLFAILPAGQGTALRALWEEFDRMDTPDSAFAAAADRIQPFLLNCSTGGHTWTLGQINSAMVYRRLEPIRQAMPAVWPKIREMVEHCIADGLLPSVDGEEQ